jgi:hypothetical protein
MGEVEVDSYVVSVRDNSSCSYKRYDADASTA